MSFDLDASFDSDNCAFDSDEAIGESSDEDEDTGACCMTGVTSKGGPPATALTAVQPPLVEGYPVGFLSTLQIFRTAKLQRAQQSGPELGVSLRYLCGDRPTASADSENVLPHERGLREHQREMEVRESTLSALATAQQCSTGSYIALENTKHNNLLLAVLPRH
jgi:hypothetical protein